MRINPVEPPEHNGGWPFLRYELEVTYAISGSQTTETHDVPLANPLYRIEDYKKDATYKLRARAVTQDSAGNLYRGEWSDV